MNKDIKLPLSYQGRNFQQFLNQFIHQLGIVSQNSLAKLTNLLDDWKQQDFAIAIVAFFWNNIVRAFDETRHVPWERAFIPHNLFDLLHLSIK